MKINIKLFLFLIAFASCNHPESNDFKREIDKGETTLNTNQESNKNVIKFESHNGVKYVWIKVNGVMMKFIFDTGASSICISNVEATLLYKQGTLEKSDILDVEYFQDATGTVSAGTKVNLKSVKIGNKEIYNVEATVIDNNNAPLLLGQSALENFGKIQIDNDRNEIIFE